MSRALQWVIGLGVVLVVVAVVFSSVAPFFIPRAGLAGAPPFTGPGRMFGPHMPFMPGFQFGFGRSGMRMPFMSLFGLAGCIGPLLLAGLILLVIMQFTRRPVAPLPAPAGPVAQPAVAPVLASLPVCANCGQPLQVGWRHCPNCGQPVPG